MKNKKQQPYSPGRRVLTDFFVVLCLVWLIPIFAVLINSFKANAYVNLDPFGYVDEDDLTLLQEWINEGKDINQLTLEQRAQADMDGSGDLDEEDVNALIQYLEDPRENPL